jgi:asparagine synthase (glutamine-hydrolysing)
MCGINGIYGLNKTERDVLVTNMNERLIHRGPDANLIYSDDEITLGHTRLKIIDLSDDANQPISCYQNRYVLTFNGEIFNFRELKKQLGDYPYKTKSDSEVILAAYHKWGIDMLEKIEGQFAFGIWDKSERELILVRDRMGIKPIYYFHTTNLIAFSSEIRPLIKTGLFKPELDQKSLVDYLRYQTVHAPDTIIGAVKQLMPGFYFKISYDEAKLIQYWDVRHDHDELGYYRSKEEAQNKVRELFTEAVQKRLVADVPFGAFLSGGIDSSLVVGVMSELMDQPVKTFNVSFDESEFSEAKYARIISEKFKTDHTEIKLKPKDFLDIIPDVMDDMDHPTGDGFNTWLVSKVTREAGVTMALSGLGGDELFAGYPIFKRYKSLLNKKWVLSFPVGLRKIAGDILTKVKPGIASEKISRVIIQDYFDLENIYQFDRQVLLDNQVKTLLNIDKLPAKSVYKTVHENVGFETPGYALAPLSRVSWAEMNTYMQNVLLRDADQMSMAHALEIRVPFLDYKLVEMVMGLRDDVKYPSTPKQLLTDSFSDLLPDEIVNRPKMGFVFPWKYWLKGDLKEFAETGLNKLKTRREFNEEAIDRLWFDFLNNNPRVTWSRIWPLVVLGNWIEKNDIE